MSKRKHWGKGIGHKGEPGRFFRKPHDFLLSHLYAGLSKSAKNLVDDVAAQYDGQNNGQLIATFEKLKHRGWGSEVTLLHARAELEAAEVLLETRKGGFPNRATWYALTFFDLDPHRDYDINPQVYVKGAWRLNALNGPIAPRPAKGLQKQKPRSANSANSRRKPRAGATENEAIPPSKVAALPSISVVESRALPVSGAPGTGEAEQSSPASSPDKPAAPLELQAPLQAAPGAVISEETVNVLLLTRLTADGFLRVDSTAPRLRMLIANKGIGFAIDAAQQLERRGLSGQAASLYLDELAGWSRERAERRLDEHLALKMGKLHANGARRESGEDLKARGCGITSMREDGLTRDAIWSIFLRLSEDKALRKQLLLPGVLRHLWRKRLEAEQARVSAEATP